MRLLFVLLFLGWQGGRGGAKQQCQRVPARSLNASSFASLVEASQPTIITGLDDHEKDWAVLSALRWDLATLESFFEKTVEMAVARINSPREPATFEDVRSHPVILLSSSYPPLILSASQPLSLSASHPLISSRLPGSLDRWNAD